MFQAEGTTHVKTDKNELSLFKNQQEGGVVKRG